MEVAGPHRLSLLIFGAGINRGTMVVVEGEFTEGISLAKEQICPVLSEGLTLFTI